MTIGSKGERPDFDVELELEFELQKMAPMLKQYRVELPAESKIEQTVEALRLYVPEKLTQIQSDQTQPNSGVPTYIQRESSKWVYMLKRAAADVVMFSKWYWLCCFFLLGAGIWLAVTAQQMPHMIAIMLAPLPFIVGMLEVFKGREQGVLELELACKISAHEIMLSRLLFITLNSLVLNTCLSAVMYIVHDDLSFWSLTLSWFSPFVIVASVSLWFTMRIRGNAVPMVVVSIWVTLGLIGLTNTEMVERLMDVHIFVSIIVNVGAVLLFVRQAVLILRKQSLFIEGSLDYGTDDSEYL
ncbi:hypothetical protein [Paenibacillus arenosi]|uniref:Uncharacterized protein n=1 Tax=Paenibacillus arenosi TaxID=2774142 RepID=A0ABR9B3X1_9BACL|nr:hypothetical protein [Paenibacillus arenosi]MBD8501062.1 hypothetical protein [Paenibacillus arenosi]